MRYPKVKICCISSIDEAQTAIKYGASPSVDLLRKNRAIIQSY